MRRLRTLALWLLWIAVVLALAYAVLSLMEMWMLKVDGS